VVILQQGDGVAFAFSHRPVQGTKGTYRVNLRHGVSRLRSATGTRWESYFMTASSRANSGTTKTPLNQTLPGRLRNG
jgi:hypothetical protein